MDKPQYEDGRLYDTGDKIGNMEVTAVSYQERVNPETQEVEKYNFVYHTQNPDDIVKGPEHGLELTAEDVAKLQETPTESEPEQPAPVEEPQDGEEQPA